MISDYFVFTLFAVVLALNLFSLILISLNIRKQREYRKRKRQIINWISSLSEGTEAGYTPVKKDWKIIIDQYVDLLQSVEMSAEINNRLISLFEEWNIINRLIKWLLGSRNRYRKTYAAIIMGYFKCSKFKNALLAALLREKKIRTKLFIVNSLVGQDDPAVIPEVIDSLKDLPEKRRPAFWSIVSGFNIALLDYFEILKERKNKDIELLFIYYASKFPSAILTDYIIDKTTSPDREVSLAAFRVASKYYFDSININEYLINEDREIRTVAVEALGENPSHHSVSLLIHFLSDDSVSSTAAAALSSVVKKIPAYYRHLVQRAFNETDAAIKEKLTDIVSYRLEYVFEKLLGSNIKEVKDLTRNLISRGKVSGIINFMNRNSNTVIEKQIVEIINESDNPAVIDQFRMYLDEKVLNRIGLSGIPLPEKPRTSKEKGKIFLLWVFLAFTLLGFPVTFFILNRNSLLGGTLLYAVTEYISFFIIFFSFYSIALNSFYCLMLVFSLLGVVKQGKYAELKKVSFLFKENILPSISIIAPAYNEESTIIESINSLLNLRYPDFEVIVVNDGSKDKTMEKVIKYFELEKSELNFELKLNTREIRAVYRGAKYPELIFVDKMNGGKADSLNCGINASSKEYFVGIDSDSLLERDAILRITGSFLDDEKEVIAAGGNILPVNGCDIKNGYIRKIGVGKNNLARFQTVEYLRAFMAGRIGWAHINALLIVSGAFGVFNRKMVIANHGYMTESSFLDKDTVGEDMELVVRLKRVCMEKKEDSIIKYTFDANCWTEIPESWKIIFRQRDRWQRGLIDIMTYHLKMLFNPRFGTAGLIAFPYYFIFEMLGPWLELQGYLVFFTALALGMADFQTSLFFVTAAVFYSIFVTNCSLYISEYKTEIFRTKDRILLILYSFLEAFGFRQISSFLRVRGYVSSLKQVSGWGKMERKGFKSEQPAADKADTTGAAPGV